MHVPNVFILRGLACGAVLSLLSSCQSSLTVEPLVTTNAVTNRIRYRTNAAPLVRFVQDTNYGSMYYGTIAIGTFASDSTNFSLSAWSTWSTLAETTNFASGYYVASPGTFYPAYLPTYSNGGTNVYLPFQGTNVGATNVFRYAGSRAYVGLSAVTLESNRSYTVYLNYDGSSFAQFTNGRAVLSVTTNE